VWHEWFGGKPICKKLEHGLPSSGLDVGDRCKGVAGICGKPIRAVEPSAHALGPSSLAPSGRPAADSRSATAVLDTFGDNLDPEFTSQAIRRA